MEFPVEVLQGLKLAPLETNPIKMPVEPSKVLVIENVPTRIMPSIKKRKFTESEIAEFHAERKRKIQKQSPKEAAQYTEDKRLRKIASNKRKYESWLSREPDKFNRVFSLLKLKYPNVFNPRLPMEFGIHKIVQEETEISSRDIHYFFKVYCSSITYLENFEKYTHRYDIRGKAAVEITEEDREVALKIIKDVKAKARPELKFEKSAFGENGWS